MSKKILYIASAGGHLSELMALEPLSNDDNWFLMTEKTKTVTKLIEQYPQQIGLLIYGTKEHPFSYPFKLLGNCFISLYYYLKFRPDIIITTGVHSAAPMCCIGKIFGSKVIFIESFANITTRSASGSIIYKFADHFIVQWESMKELYPNSEYGGWIY